MNHNIELIRYMRFGDDLLLLEQVNAVSAPTVNGTAALEPELVVPELNVNDPLTPFEPASTDLIAIEPLDVAVPLPPMTEMAPPVAPLPLPAVMSI